MNWIIGITLNALVQYVFSSLRFNFNSSYILTWIVQKSLYYLISSLYCIFAVAFSSSTVLPLSQRFNIIHFLNFVLALSDPVSALASMKRFSFFPFVVYIAELVQCFLSIIGKSCLHDRFKLKLFPDGHIPNSVSPNSSSCLPHKSHFTHQVP